MPSKRLRSLFVPICFALLLIACGGDDGGSEPVPPPSPPAAISAVQIVSGNNQTGTAGSELAEALVGKIVDSAGNGLSGRVLNFHVGTGGGSIFAGSATSDGSGNIRERWTLGTGTGAQQVEVRGVDTTGAAVVYARFNATAIAGVATSAVAISGAEGQAAIQTQTLPAPIGVLVSDSYGNPKSGVTVTFAPCPNCGTVTPTSAITDAAGNASVAWTLGVPVGAQRVIASIAGLPNLQINATATRAAPGAPASLLAQYGDGQTVTEHNRLGAPLGVWVADILGNGVPGAAVTFAAGPGSPAFTTETINTNADGYAYFQPYFHEAGNVLVQASVTGLPPVSFNVTVAATAYDYDGVYPCTFVQTVGGTRPTLFYTMHIDQGVVSGEQDGDPSHAIFDVTLDLATGAISGNYRASLDVRYPWTGMLTPGANASVTGSGTYYVTSINNPTGASGVWNCTRN